MRALIITVCILVLLLTVGTIVIGSRSFDGVVVEKPYETGLAWDKAEQQREKLGWNVSLDSPSFRTGRNDLVIMVADRDRRIIGDARVDLKVTRPSTTSFDRSYAAEPQADGRYRASVELAQPGNWDVIVRVQRGAAISDYTVHLYAERRSP
jgi:nitrogen fixation protein FixH